MSVVCLFVCCSFVVVCCLLSYRPQFSSDPHQIYTQPVFLNYLEVLFWIFWNFEFWPPFLRKIGLFRTFFWWQNYIYKENETNFHPIFTKFIHNLYFYIYWLNIFKNFEILNFYPPPPDCKNCEKTTSNIKLACDISN